MRFVYKWAHMPSDKVMIAELNAAAQRLYDKLMEAGPSAPSMDDFYRARFYKKGVGSNFGHQQIS